MRLRVRRWDFRAPGHSGSPTWWASTFWRMLPRIFRRELRRGDSRRILQEVVKRGWLGDKSGQGFYKKTRGADGKDQRMVLDLATFEYRPSAKPALPSLEMAKNAATVQERVKLLLANDPKKDKAARFLWPFLSSLWNFAAERIGEAADDAPSIDQAMRAGFNWELGPFELWDAAGVRESVTRMKALDIPVSAAVRGLLDSAPESSPVSWYSPDGPQCYNPVSGAWEPIPQQPGHARVADFRRTNGVVRSNPGASLVDIGDGIGCIELHSLKNAIGGDVVAMITSVLNPDLRGCQEFPRLCDQRRPRPLQCGREPDATAARRAGGRLGRSRRGHSRVSADVDVDQVLSAARGGRAVQSHAGWRSGNLAARCASPALCGDLHRPCRNGHRADPRRWRNEGNAAAGRGCSGCARAT